MCLPNWKQKAQDLDTRCARLWDALQAELASKARLTNEIEMLIAIGQEYGVSLTPSWIERLRRVLDEENAPRGIM